MGHTLTEQTNIDGRSGVTVSAKSVNFDSEGKRVVKPRLRARLAGVPEPTGRGSIVVPVSIVDQPGQYADLSIPASRLEAHVRQLLHALQRERTLQAWAKSGEEPASGT